MTQENNTFCGLSKGPVPAEITIPQFTAMAISPLAEYAGAIWKGSPNYWGGRGKEQVIAICDHIMAGSIEAANSWFHNSDAEASAHFGVGKLGQVYQWVSIWDSAWANGIMNRPNTAIPWIAECANKGINPNLRTVSIEHEGQPGDKFTDAQYQATLALHRFLISTFKIPVDRQHIIRHADIDSVDRPYCPGPSFPWKDLIADLAPAPAPQPPAFDPNPNGFTVGQGMLAKLTELKEQAGTNEQYGNFGPALKQRSMLWTKSGKTLIAYEDSGWEVRVYQEL